MRKEQKANYPESARGAAALLVRMVLEDGAYTNIALNQYLRGSRLSDLDRRLATELVYGTVKASGTLDWYLAQCVSRPLDKVAGDILAILRISTYQLLYMTRIPASAAVNEAVKLARSVSHEGSAKFVNGVLRGLLRKQEAGAFVLPDTEKQDADYLSLQYYHPRWLVKRWLGPWGRGGTERLLAFDNTAAPVCLRVNTLVTTRDKLLADLTEMGAQVHASEWSPYGIVAEHLPSRLMQDKGEVIACDIHEHKLELIAENAARLGMKSVKALQNDALQLRSEWLGVFDRVLVDAPCSGLGVLRRRAEARWRKQRKDLKLFPPLQLAILKNAAQYVKDGGTMVYSTCTIEQSENHYLVEEFLTQHPEWQRVEFTHPLTGEQVQELQLLPQNDGIDGFYICKLMKKQ